MYKANYIIKFVLISIFLILLQVAVLNKISLFNIATPIIYIYIILKLPIALNRNIITIIGFLIGLTIDIFCNTPGINAAATTLVSFFRRPIQSLFFVVEDFEEQIPTLATQQWVFVKTMIMFVFIHHFTLLTIESFSLFNPLLLFGRIVASTLLSSLIILAFEGFSTNGRKQ